MFLQGLEYPGTLEEVGIAHEKVGEHLREIWSSPDPARVVLGGWSAARFMNPSRYRERPFLLMASML